MRQRCDKVFFLLYSSNRENPITLLKISILLRRPAQLTPDNFSKFRLEPSPTRKAQTRLITLLQVSNQFNFRNSELFFCSWTINQVPYGSRKFLRTALTLWVATNPFTKTDLALYFLCLQNQIYIILTVMPKSGAGDPKAERNGSHLRSLAPGQHSFYDTSRRSRW